MYSSWMVTFEHLCVYSYDGYDGAPSAGDNDDWYSFHRLFTWQLYGNNLFQAILFQLYLQTYCEGLMFFFSFVWRYEMMPVMNNPVFASRSPSDFWGRRWNLLVHNALKNGVFKPAHRYVSKTAAVAATFLVSGIFHEWLLIALHAPMPHQQVDQEQSGSGNCSNCVSVVYGSATIFFAWQGILVSIEALVRHWSIFTKLDKILPMPVRTALIIASGIPVSCKKCYTASIQLPFASSLYKYYVYNIMCSLARLFYRLRSNQPSLTLSKCRCSFCLFSFLYSICINQSVGALFRRSLRKIELLLSRHGGSTNNLPN
jgi:hypothetical protein